jgi:hypothetical protein
MRCSASDTIVSLDWWVTGDTFQRDGCQKCSKWRKRGLVSDGWFYTTKEVYGPQTKILEDKMRIFDRRFNGRP